MNNVPRRSGPVAAALLATVLGLTACADSGSSGGDGGG